MFNKKNKIKALIFLFLFFLKKEYSSEIFLSQNTRKNQMLAFGGAISSVIGFCVASSLQKDLFSDQEKRKLDLLLDFGTVGLNTTDATMFDSVVIFKKKDFWKRFKEEMGKNLTGNKFFLFKDFHKKEEFIFFYREKESPWGPAVFKKNR